MSKTKKQITNEKRTRRLGTGEGIAPTRSARQRRSGFMSFWALLATGVVALAVVVGAVVVLTRGGESGGGGSATGQGSSVVQARLSHAKLDFLSAPTWEPNATNLAGAMQALDLPGPSDAINHYHVHLTLYVDGRQVPIPSNIGVSSTVLSPIHTHDDSGVLHIEADDQSFRGNLGQFFDVWGVYMTPKCMGGYCDGVKMWVNGKPSSDFGSLVLQKHQAITMVVGKEPKNFKPDSSYKFPPGE